MESSHVANVQREWCSRTIGRDIAYGNFQIPGGIGDCLEVICLRAYPDASVNCLKFSCRQELYHIHKH